MASSIEAHERVARWFLARLAVPLDVSLRALEAGDVTGFVVAQSRSGRLGAGAAKNLIWPASNSFTPRTRNAS